MGSSETLVRRVADLATPERIERIGCVFEVRFAGEETRWVLNLTEGASAIVSTTAPEDVEVCKLGFHAEDLEDLLEGQTSLKGLVAAGRLRVFGNMGDAMKLEALFK